MSKHILITGGAGFIGTHLLQKGHSVIIYDSFDRPGVENNARWLVDKYGEQVELAGQVAVTTSLINSMTDFDVNLRGMMNLLEELRTLDHPPSVVFTSTNKVYGDLSDVQLHAYDHRYEPVDDVIDTYGFNENCPYGCSKGAADQYALDYARMFDEWRQGDHCIT